MVKNKRSEKQTDEITKVEKKAIKAALRANRPKWKKAMISSLKWGGAVILFVVALGAVGTAVVLKHYEKQATTVKLQLSDKPIVNSFTILDANNKPLLSNSKKAQFLPTEVSGKQKNVSDLYIKTLLETEDSTFYTRSTKGYEAKDVAKAVVSVLASKLHLVSESSVRGGSSIDQQLIKNMVFGGANAEGTLSRKVVELMDSHSLAIRYSRDEVLKGYLDSIRLTPDTIGVRAAYENLFGSDDMNSLNDSTIGGIAKTAFMAGLGQAPTQYTQYFTSAPKGYLTGKQRTIIILGVMKKNDLISENQYKETVAYVKSDAFKLKSSTTAGVPRAYQSYVAEVNQEIATESLPSNSEVVVKTYTTQQSLNELYGVATAKRALTVPIPESNIPSPKDVTAIAVVDPKTGHITGLSTNNEDPTVPFTAVHSSGSTIKPLLDYAPAIEYGIIGPYSVLNGNGANSAGGIAYSGMTPGTAGAAPQNYGGRNYGAVNATYALDVSLNSAALQLFQQTTSAQKLSIIQPMGLAENYNAHLNEEGYPDESLSINYTISMLQDAAAYATLANDGIFNKPTAIQSITVNGDEINRTLTPPVRVLSSSTAQTLNQMLQGVTNADGSEPYAAPQYLGQPGGTYSVKSGLSNYPQDSMGAYSPDALMSYTSPNLAVSVWLGAPDLSPDPSVGIPNGTGNQPENNGRVYLLNATVQALMGQNNNDNFTYTGQKLVSNTPDKVTVPNLIEGPTQKDIDETKGYNPNLKKPSKAEEDYYNEHKNDSLITQNQVVKPN